MVEGFRNPLEQPGTVFDDQGLGSMAEELGFGVQGLGFRLLDFRV